MTPPIRYQCLSGKMYIKAIPSVILSEHSESKDLRTDFA